MKLFGSYSVLNYLRRAKERESYISSSLTPPADLSKRLLSTSSEDSSRSLAMQFHHQWRHPDCPVMKWYQQQQFRSSTQFTSIEHWRTKQAPFYHEYLLIRLKSEEGDICRVERMGDGSRKDAITRVGCTAYDIIQCCSAAEYALNPVSQEPAGLICRIEFPRVFDLLDVLAICWSVQQTQRCSVYTLQRYNCYFLCLTILAVLARRVGEWEEAIDTKEVWVGLVDSMITCLQQTPCGGADEYMGLGICHIIDPEGPNPRGFILESFRTRLRINGLEYLKTSISATLWMKNFEAEIKQSLGSQIEYSADAALGSTSTSATKIKLVLEFDASNEDDCRVHNISQEFIETFGRQLLSIFVQVVSEMVTSVDRMRRMREIEYRPALLQRIASLVLVPIECLYMMIQASGMLVDEGHEGGNTLWDECVYLPGTTKFSS
ncbi:hypothetical protein FRC11_008778 [Ceratobasidium sp. 423]|nr:hypothetical protein FRC11_008778 [Ceratobasidium sp. 423]